MSICECGQVSVPLGKVSVQVFGTIHGVTACGPSDRHWKDRAEKAEAAIARVRELCYPRKEWLSVREYELLYPAVTAEGILRALDGPCPTCRGPIRETVGLVCQTCGTDYGRLDGTA